MTKKNILNQKKMKKTMKPVNMPKDKNCPVNVPLQFEVQKDLNVAKRIQANKVFENYKMNVKKVSK
jgi:hypothetical protein